MPIIRQTSAAIGSRVMNSLSFYSGVWRGPDIGPRGSRETEFDVGGSRRRKPTGLAPFATDKMMLGIKSRRETGSTTWLRDCHGIGGGVCHRSPFGAGIRPPSCSVQAPSGQSERPASRPTVAASGSPAVGSGP